VPDTLTAPTRYLTGDQARRAADLVRLLARRCADPDEVAAVAADPANRHPGYGTAPWDPASLAYGWPGTAVLYGQLARYDPQWTRVAHHHLTAAARALSTRAGTRGVWNGLSAVAFAAETCAVRDGDYRKLRGQLISRVASGQLRAPAATPSGPGVLWETYDVISGPAGTGRLLLDAVDDHSTAQIDEAVVVQARQALTEMLNRLVRITEPVEVDGERVPGWWVRPELQPDAERTSHPRGHFNFGLAHGVAGPLALLALATERGHIVPGQIEAMNTIARWLCRWARTDEAGPYWTTLIGWDEEIDPGRPRVTMARSAWCYGAPGIAVALHRAGAVLGEAKLRDLAVRALHAVIDRAERDWRLTGPGMCHGYGGLLNIFTRIAEAEDDPVLRAGALRVASRVLDHADENAPFVFPDVVPEPNAGRGLVRVNTAGLLDGAAGAGCALLSVIPPTLLAPGGQVRPAGRPWDRVFLLG